MSKKGTGDWKPLDAPTNEPVPARGKTRVGPGELPADIVLPICPHTLQIVPAEEEEE